MAKQELTKKNQAFVFQLRKILLSANKLSGEDVDQITNEVEETLASEQGSGRTAAQIYGTPHELSAKYLSPQRTAKQLYDYPRWVIMLDTSLVLLVFMSLWFALTTSFGKGNPQSEGLGIISTLLLSALGGVFYTLFSYWLVPNPKEPKKRPRWLAWVLIPGAVLVWMGSFVLATLLPVQINPVLPSIGYLIVAALGFLIIRWNRQQAGMEKMGIMAISKLMQQARANANNQK
ncbi:DUF1129 family protein [Leuconostocaceae bacterium ESL0723]|nr:DUF1129 family protein [Leuconostocaceae bacterium ESL0723]